MIKLMVLRPRFVTTNQGILNSILDFAVNFFAFSGKAFTAAIIWILLYYLELRASDTSFIDHW